MKPPAHITTSPKRRHTSPTGRFHHQWPRESLGWHLLIMAAISMWMVTFTPAAPASAEEGLEVNYVKPPVSILPRILDDPRRAPTQGDLLELGETVMTDRIGLIDLVRSNTICRLDALTTAILTKEAKLLLVASQGKIYYKDTSTPKFFAIRTPEGEVLGMATELHVEIAEGKTVVTMIEGSALMYPKGAEARAATNYQRWSFSAGQVPDLKTPRLTRAEVVDTVEWALYYPGALNPDELSLPEEDQRALAKSLEFYRQGNLVAALTNAVAVFPPERQPNSTSTALYLAALKLTAGRVEEVRAFLRGATGKDAALQPFVEALQQLIDAVTFRVHRRSKEPILSTEWLAESYYQQALPTIVPDPPNSEWERRFYGQFDRYPDKALRRAKEAALRAVQRSPDFGFAWARLAELEFSFGNADTANQYLQQALQLSGANAQAHALKGFVAAARRDYRTALDAMETATVLDGGLANGWLGLGLLKIKTGAGSLESGVLDLQTAVTKEPQQSVFRSYLGKGFYHQATFAPNPAVTMRRLLAPDGTEAVLIQQAEAELELAKELDPYDPTPWLYSALMKFQENRINEAVRELEESQDLNDNRQLYRSRLMLDQDRAVRSANLAAIYRDAGMAEVSVREATRAVQSDYANYSAHLFLANSYDALRDPRQVTLRYETPWLSELLVANLLQPPGVGSLSQHISQQEYSRLFERNHWGLFSFTRYTSAGDWTQAGSLYGNTDGFSFSLDSLYRSLNEEWSNGDLEDLTFWAKVKQRVGRGDSSLFLQAIYYDFESGDVLPRFDFDAVQSTLKVREKQEPILLAGYHHVWNPHNHTLFLAARLDDTFRVRDRFAPGLVMFRNLTNGIDPTYVGTNFSSDQAYRSEFEIYSAELQHQWTSEDGVWELIGGARFQAGEFETDSLIRDRTGLYYFPPVLLNTPIADQSVKSDFSRFSIYQYTTWEPVEERLLLVGGITYDWLEYPINHRVAPVSEEEKRTDKVSPKAGFIWTPSASTTVRGAYTRSLGGVSHDQSFRLEPVQVAGFLQSYRSLIPEALAGSMPAESVEAAALSIDHRFRWERHSLYLGLTGEWLESDVDREEGVFNGYLHQPLVPAQRASELTYNERSLLFTANYLLHERWAFGVQYRLAESELEEHFSGPGSEDSEQSSLLHDLNLFALYQARCGFFTEMDAIWRLQDNDNNDAAISQGDDFWQLNLHVGYRFPHRRGEVRLGILNLTDEDYRLYPLNFYSRLPRDRTLYTSLKLNF